MLARMQSILEDRRFEWTITALIIINAITLGLETWPAANERFGDLFHLMDRAILVIFVIEIALRLAIHRMAFFRDPWSIFDFVVVAIALTPSTGSLSVLRALRVLRVLRIISFVPSSDGL